MGAVRPGIWLDRLPGVEARGEPPTARRWLRQPRTAEAVRPWRDRDDDDLDACPQSSRLRRGELAQSL